MLSSDHEDCFPEFYEKEEKGEYNEGIHVERLYEMFKKIFDSPKSLCLCPASSEFGPENAPGDIWKDYEDDTDDPCVTCKNFVDIADDKTCPCIELPSKRALKITIEKMYEKQYISLEESRHMFRQLDASVTYNI